MLLAADNTFSGWPGIASITFAYLAAAHFVGAKLSRFQAAVATVFYATAASGFRRIAFTVYRRAVFFLHGLTENYGVRAMAPNDAFLPVDATVFGLLIPACIYFMYQVRRNAKTVEPTG